MEKTNNLKVIVTALDSIAEGIKLISKTIRDFMDLAEEAEPINDGVLIHDPDWEDLKHEEQLKEARDEENLDELMAKEIKPLLTALAKNGYSSQVKALIATYTDKGKLSAIDKSDYKDLYQKAKEIK